jgi:hypothetical protein
MFRISRTQANNRIHNLGRNHKMQKPS